MSTVKENLSRSIELKGSDSARLDTEVLLCHVLDRPRAWLYTWPEYPLTPTEQSQFDQLFERRKVGEPVAYLTGEREFWSLPLKVNASTLIPRPETELLVETALQLCPSEKLLALDLGTGTGAIALALAAEKPGWTIVAAEKSTDALSLAKENCKALGFGNVELVKSDWFTSIPRRAFDLIISNPPYIDADDPHLTEGDVRFEPRSALVAEGEGLADIEAIAQQSGEYLKSGGWLVVEHGWQQAAAVREVFARVGLHHIESRKDYSGWERVTLGRK